MDDPRDSRIYKLVLKHRKELEKLSCSNRRVLKDLSDFNFSEDRQNEIIKDQIESITTILEAQSYEILHFSPIGDCT